MSNNVGLMFSLIFLAFFIVFSGEVLALQKTSAKMISATNNIAVYIQEKGYDDGSIRELEIYKYLDYFDVEIVDKNTNMIKEYVITSKKQYVAFSTVFSFMTQDIVCKVTVCRKE